MSKIYVAAATALTLSALGINGCLAYAWSFSDTTFGGYLGLAIPCIMTLGAAVGGYCLRDASAD